MTQYILDPFYPRGLSPKVLQAILLDANLGGIDTVRLAMNLRVSAPDAAIVVSSGSAEEHIRKLFSEFRYDMFLAKPYTLAELRQVLADVQRRNSRA